MESKKPSGKSAYAKRKRLRVRVSRILKMDGIVPVPCFSQEIKARFFPRAA